MAGSVRVPIPIRSGQNVIPGITPERLRYLDSISKFKPPRVLGAVWTSDKVARRKPVAMCENCWRRYRNWWKKEEYRPDWGWRYIGDCDGCSTRNILVTLFVCEEKFSTVLAPQHGLNPQP